MSAQLGFASLYLGLNESSLLLCHELTSLLDAHLATGLGEDPGARRHHFHSVLVREKVH